MQRSFKTLSILPIFTFCPHKLSYVLYSADWLNWGLQNYNWFSAVYYQISLEGYQTICALDSFHLQKGQQAFDSIYKPVYSQDHPKRTSADMEFRSYQKP